MSEPVQLVIIVEGGSVQDVLTCGIPLRVAIVDYDEKDSDEPRLTTLHFNDGSTQRAGCVLMDVTAESNADSHGLFQQITEAATPQPNPLAIAITALQQARDALCMAPHTERNSSAWRATKDALETLNKVMA